MSIYHNLQAIIDVALQAAKDHNCNYNIILANPNEEGNFAPGSTYEFVTDSYFEKPRPHVKLLYKTDDFLQEETKQNNADVFNHEPIIITNYREPFTYFGNTKNDNTRKKTNNRLK